MGIVGATFITFPLESPSRRSKSFFAICDYFDITPSQFFDDGEKNPELVQKALSGMRELDDEDLLMLIGIINRLHKKK